MRKRSVIPAPEPEPESEVATVPAANPAPIPVPVPQPKPEPQTSPPAAQPSLVTQTTAQTEAPAAPVAAAQPAPSATQAAHLSERIRMDHWLPLLTTLATGLAFVAVIYIAIRLLSLIHHTVLLFALGGLVAYALDPIVEWVRGTYGPADRKRRPRWLGVLTVFALLIAVWAGGTYFLGKEAANQVSFVAANRDQIETNARAKIDEWDTYLSEHGIPVHIGELVDNPPDNVKQWGQAIARGSVGLVSDASRSMVEGIIVLLIAVYFLIYSEEMSEGTVKALPEHVRPYAVQWKNDVNRILGGFVRGQAILALIIGASAAIACALLGLRLWLLIGFFVTLASLLPVVGPYIGALPALIAAVLTPANGFLNPLTRCIAVVIVFFLINEGGSKVLYPRLVGRALGLHEVVVLMVLLAGFELGGIPGVLFAAPLTALTVVTVAQLYRLWHGQPPVSLAEEAREGGMEQKKAGTP